METAIQQTLRKILWFHTNKPSIPLSSAEVRAEMSILTNKADKDAALRIVQVRIITSDTCLCHICLHEEYQRPNARTPHPPSPHLQAKLVEDFGLELREVRKGTATVFNLRTVIDQVTIDRLLASETLRGCHPSDANGQLDALALVVLSFVVLAGGSISRGDLSDYLARLGIDLEADMSASARRRGGAARTAAPLASTTAPGVAGPSGLSASEPLSGSATGAVRYDGTENRGVPPWSHMETALRDLVDRGILESQMQQGVQMWRMGGVAMSEMGSEGVKSWYQGVMARGEEGERAEEEEEEESEDEEDEEDEEDDNEDEDEDVYE